MSGKVIYLTPVVPPLDRAVAMQDLLQHLFALGLEVLPVGLRARLPGVPLIVDAGIGSPADAVQAMELGLDGVLLNTAVAKALDPVCMAQAFGLGVRAGRLAYVAGVMAKQDMAVASTPVAGYPILL